MCKRTVVVLLSCLLLSTISFAEQSLQKRKIDVVTFWAQQQYDNVPPAGKAAVAVHFDLEKDWHFYASADTAPAGMNLKIEPNEQGETQFLKFAQPIWPKSEKFYDPALDVNLDVFSGQFTVYLPFTVADDAPEKTVTIDIGIDGAICSAVQCRVPDFGRVRTELKIAKDAVLTNPNFELPKPVASAVTQSSLSSVPAYSLWAALVLAFVAGLLVNLMPCVWPVLPIIILRLVDQAKKGKSASLVMGLAFCLGILLFFAVLAGANIVLQVFYGQVLQWGDQFRNPWFVTAMAMLLVVLALFMFGLFTINIPSSLAGGTSPKQGLTGAVGMGFLAAILSTPCSFGILAAAFAWAQTQPLTLATLAIMTIGIGMAAPYLILTALPALLQKVPKPGRWMELFKQAIGFVMLGIALKLIAALPAGRQFNVLYFALVISFCVWMWAGWVDYGTPAIRKWVIRIIAIIIAVAAGFELLSPARPSLIDWQKYDAAVIKTDLAENKPVLIDFTAEWCLSCKVVDKTVYFRKDIAGLIKQKGVVAVKADTTLKDYLATIDLKNVYDEPGVPVTILLIPGQTKPMRWRGIAFGDELKSALEKLPSK
jgi:thiol:disulfide interchange protein